MQWRFQDFLVGVNFSLHSPPSLTPSLPQSMMMLRLEQRKKRHWLMLELDRSNWSDCLEAFGFGVEDTNEFGCTHVLHIKLWPCWDPWVAIDI